MNIKELIENADNAYYATEYDKAIQLYMQVLDLDPDNKHAQQQLRKAEFNQPLRSANIDKVPLSAVQLYKRSRSFIAIGDLAEAKKLLKQAIDIAKESGVDFYNAQELVENMQNALQAQEFKNKALENLDTQQWAKAEANLNFALALDPTDNTTQRLLSHLHSLLTAHKLINSLNAGSVRTKDRLATIREIRDIIKSTNETAALSTLWQEVVRLFGEYNSFVIPQERTGIVLALLISAGILGALSASYDWSIGINISVTLLVLALVLFVLTILPLLRK